MIVNIDQKVSIDPKFLDSNISYHLLQKIRSMEGKCTFDYGYIITVNKIVELGENIIAPANSLVVYNVKYEADTIKPEKGMELRGEICMVFQHGVFVDILKKLKVLIPVASLEGYTFTGDSFVSKEDDENIKVGSEVNIRITIVKYDKKSFSCIGELIK